MDVYQRHLHNTVIEIEERYSLHTLLSPNIKVVDLGIKEFLEEVRKIYESSKEEDIKTMNIRAGQKVAMLAYLDNRLRFFNYVKLDFSVYPSLDKVVSTLKIFTNKDTLNKDSRGYANIIAETLEQIEERFEIYRKSLGYKFLRLFLVLLIFNNDTDASVVANLIVNQILISRRSDKDARRDKKFNRADRQYK